MRRGVLWAARLAHREVRRLHAWIVSSFAPGVKLCPRPAAGHLGWALIIVEQREPSWYIAPRQGFASRLRSAVVGWISGGLLMAVACILYWLAASLIAASDVSGQRENPRAGGEQRAREPATERLRDVPEPTDDAGADVGGGVSGCIPGDAQPGDGDPPCPGPGDCCSSNESPGCNDPACCRLICERDPFCCAGGWDVSCAVQANDLCGGGEPFCPWCPAAGGCCELRGGPGCDREACCAAVCDIEPECCVVGWSSACTELVDKICFPTVCACDALGDFDNDGAVDLRDMAEFANCFTGLEGGPIDKVCACGDANGDASVDLLDYRVIEPLHAP